MSDQTIPTAPVPGVQVEQPAAAAAPAEQPAPAVAAPVEQAAPAAPAEPLAPVSLDLDSLEKIDVLDDVVTEPFTFRLAGAVFELMDPRDIDWQDLTRAVQNPLSMLRYALPRDQQDLFYALPMEGWKLQVIFERWNKHFKMGSPEELAQVLNG
ncbi:hypothetical protein [Actinoplanes sp. URMC 104]|uniref:hypothetical protein n=1 Tax=Actinoplanes sp. URMC 104 TaxID=3423409 RepID=UPI003F1BB9A0